MMQKLALLLLIHLSLIGINTAEDADDGIYFPVQGYRVTVSPSLQQDEPIISVHPRLRRLSADHHRDAAAEITCRLETEEKDGAPLDHPAPYRLDPLAHRLRWWKPESVTPIDSNTLTGLYTLTLNCSTATSYGTINVTMDVIDVETWAEKSCDQNDVQYDICFGVIGRLLVEEESENGVLAELGNEALHRKCLSRKRRHTVEADDPTYRGAFKVIDGALSSERPFDRESMSIKDKPIKVKLECHLSTPNSDTIVLKKEILVSVLDVNDCGPKVVSRGRRKTLNLSPNKPLVLTFTDRDTVSVNKFEAPSVEIQGQPSTALDDGSYKRAHIASGDVTYYTTEIKYEALPNDTPFNVVFVDNSVVSLAGKSEANKVTFAVNVIRPIAASAKSGAPRPTSSRLPHVHQSKFKSKKTFTLSRSVARYTRLNKFLLKREVEGPEIPRYRLAGDYSSMFNLTEETGILYVDDVEALRACKLRRVLLNVTVTGAGRWEITVKLTDGVNPVDPVNPAKHGGECEESCSVFYKEEQCVTSCGLGAPESSCQWRKNNVTSGVSRQYETCTPSVDFCPDGECDELERLIPGLCPQDCAELVEGEGVSMNRDYEPARGIIAGESPCWCGINNCTCGGLAGNGEPTQRTRSNIIIDHSKGNGAKATASNGLHSSEKAVGNMQTRKLPGRNSDLLSLDNCGSACKIVAVVILTVATFAIICIATGCHLHRKRKMGKMKMGSAISLSAAIPSDYVEDQDRPSGVISNASVESALKNWELKNKNIPSLISNALYMPSCPDGSNYHDDYPVSFLPPDPKWEIPRANLKLGRSLGEGEFGKVVRAQAINLNGRTGYTTVAVKMLKDCASAAEFRDLMSEYLLLKDVTHRNVVKLIGVCSQPGGPFYLVVDYCKHGSLRSYLRKCRMKQEVYLGNEEFPLDSDNEDCDPDAMRRHDDISAKDLLSFSWQIANGMAYLCEMKLVHRDLAARNVLVAGDKMMKISDFGLTRDIYEGDAYFRKSKGRIPVKWMAPESLYDQVYTSKSDVWSFGVALWEVVTLGAVPYPGIAPERLYQMLKTGYRMERPDNCSQLLFSIMERCWARFPSERPSFKELSEIFENLLKSREDYLDLSFVIETPCTYEDDPISNVPDVTSNTRLPVDEPEYGSINILTTDDDSYVVSPNAGSSNQKLRHNDVIYEGVLTSADEADHVMQNTSRSRAGSVDETTSFLDNTPAHTHA